MQHTDDAGAEVSLVRTGMRTPRAAAIAGIVFAVLLIASLWLLRLSTPSNPLEIGSWLSESSERESILH